MADGVSLYRGGDRARAALKKKYPHISDDMLPASDAEIKLMDILVNSITDPKEKAQVTDRLSLTFVRGFARNRWKDLPEKEAIEKTKPIFKACMQFRAKYDCKNALSRAEPKDYGVHKREWINQVMGTDRDGRLVIMFNFFSSEYMKAFPVERQEAFVANQIRELETVNRWKNRAEKKMNEKLLYKQVLIVDMSAESASMAKANYFKAITAWSPSSTKTKDESSEFNFLSDFYPETLLNLWAVNTPFMFRAIWNVAKQFVDPITAKKFNIVSGVPLQEMVKAGIPLECIPKYLGGKGRDPRGYHYKVNVGSGSALDLPMYSVKRGQRFSWDFSTTATYVFVSIRHNKTTEVLARTKLVKKSHLSGSFDVPEDGEIVVTFDNKGSSWYSADVLHEINIDSPSTTKDEEDGEDEASSKMP